MLHKMQMVPRPISETNPDISVKKFVVSLDDICFVDPPY